MAAGGSALSGQAPPFAEVRVGAEGIKPPPSSRCRDLRVAMPFTSSETETRYLLVTRNELNASRVPSIHPIGLCLSCTAPRGICLKGEAFHAAFPSRPDAALLGMTVTPSPQRCHQQRRSYDEC